MLGGEHETVSPVRWMSRALLSLLLLAALSGCPSTSSAPCDSDAECPDGRCRFGACGPLCLDDADCPAGLTCSGGTCQPRPECAAATDCAEGFACTNGRCACQSDAACAANQMCRQGRCEDRARCTGNEDCTAGQRCDVTLGTCRAACASAAECAPGLDPQAAALLYVCREGNCLRRCVNDASCGGQGLICEAGLCERSTCATQSDCPAGQYCTSATTGRCVAYTACTSTARCGANFECRAFSLDACPPGFDCEQRICQELPRCLIDADCSSAGTSGGAFCQGGHCQPTPACGSGVPCASGRVCVAGLCMPGGCRGHADCPAGQACTDGACHAPPSASDILSVAVSPRAATLVVGDSVHLSLVAFTVSGGSFPLATGTFTVVDSGGAPSDAATVTPSGDLTAIKSGTVRVRAGVDNPGVTPAEATLTLLPALTKGRRVTVVDATTGRPLASVEVLGCDAPPADAPCPAPVSVTTDASGTAPFPTFTGATASFSLASPELRADGFARYDRLSVASTSARDVLLPLTENPVHAAAGFNASIQFNAVHSTGPLWLGFSMLSVGDVPELDLTTLLGEPFLVTVPGLPQPVPAPGSLVAYVTAGAGSPVELKGRSLGVGQPGRRAGVAFAGEAGLTQVGNFGSTDLLAYTGALDYAVQAFTPVSLRPRVPDTTDLDGDGLCADAAKCPQGTEDVPDYFRFPGFTFRPQREQARRTEVVLPRLPPGLDTAVVSAVELSAEEGLVPLGFSARTAGAPLPDGTRPVDPILLRSGAPYGGVEAGSPGVWALATQGTSGGNQSGRIVRGPTLPTRAEVPAFLPLPAATYAPSKRTLQPASGSWSPLVQAGADLGRLTLTGPRGRHVVLFELASSPGAVRVPESPGPAGEDPAGQTGATLEVVAMDFSPGTSAADALDADGPNLTGLAVILDGYSHSRP